VSQFDFKFGRLRKTKKEYQKGDHMFNFKKIFSTSLSVLLVGICMSSAKSSAYPYDHDEIRGNSFNEITDEQILELRQLASRMERGELDPMQLTIAINISRAAVALRCGGGGVETAVHFVLGSIPLVSRAANGFNGDIIRSETMDITIGDLEIEGSYYPRNWTGYGAIEGTGGMWAGGLLTAIWESGRYFLDYEDAQITQDHFNGLRAAYLSTINTKRVTLGVASECRQTYRRIRLMRGKATVDDLLREAGQLDDLERLGN
jgi:hypothetical protein